MTTNFANTLNRGCICRTLDEQRLREQLESDPGLTGLAHSIAQTRPHLFSATAVFLSSSTFETIAATVAAIERVVSTPGYQATALARAPAIAQHPFGPAGVFMGYDFHVNADGPQLIEINTNAGGALLNAALARAQKSCCESMSQALAAYTPLHAALGAVEQTFFDMFKAEWRAQRGELPLRSLVIVDDDPQAQYLAPEFELCRHMFLQRGLSASIADPRELEWRDGSLWHGQVMVDMVYNRLTDFYLAEPAHQALRDAYTAGATVVTPHPRAHALLADKRNLVTLSDAELLAAWGVGATDRQLLAAAVPATQRVTPQGADELWARRRQLFFKPVAGYGAKAVYRGDKLTRKVWDEILAGDFIAQALVPPGQRMVVVDGVQTDLKFDVRAYTYAGQIQLLAARTYQGQTTNFRTPGGGFSPVVVVPQLDDIVTLLSESGSTVPA
ncbi:hypothetical protein [Rhodoferax sp. UBA5149]|uniref:hypothetical protein n=1 Tax=Rhodoferax sp. UBA5149 TaxID=1947379 RepID=UPI0025E534FD|nr:hypothetical protein [Rhodoferax sp. UBA5149]